MKTKMEYTTVEKIDDQLQRMESQLQHTSMPLAEEKKVVDNMEKLRKSRVCPITAGSCSVDYSARPPGCSLLA